MSVLRRTLQRLGLGAGPLLQQQLAGLEARLARSQQQQQDAQQALLAGLEAAQLQQRHLVERIEAQQQALEAMRRQLTDTVKKEALNTARQVESFLSLQAVLSDNDGACVVPPMHGWPVSPDLALHVAMLLKTERYDQVIEFGSGSSTLVMARVLSQLGRGRLLTFEHLPAYRDQTAALLSSQALDALVDLRLAPLAPHIGADGRSWAYYDCDAALGATAQALRELPSPKLLLFVDGPPAATGPRARQPALEAVLAHFPDCELHVLLDDYIRQDEKDIVTAWEAALRSAGRRYTHAVLALEKGASLLRIEARAAAAAGTVRTDGAAA